MKALGMVEVYSFSTAVAAADVAAKTADVSIIAFDRNRPVSADVPAPLVMEIKMEGSVSAVQAAVEAAKEYAQKDGKHIVSHTIANPAEDTEYMAYLLDINKDKHNQKLPKTMKNIELPESNGEAIGLLEVQGLVASIEGIDNMLKAANVRLVHMERRLGGRLVTAVVAGGVSSVKASLESGKAAAGKLGEVFGCELISNPSPEIIKFFDIGG